jgi:hypothetical protein
MQALIDDMQQVSLLKPACCTRAGEVGILPAAWPPVQCRAGMARAGCCDMLAPEAELQATARILAAVLYTSVTATGELIMSSSATRTRARRVSYRSSNPWRSNASHSSTTLFMAECSSTFSLRRYAAAKASRRPRPPSRRSSSLSC